MVLMDVLSDEEEFNVSNDPGKIQSGNYASHHAGDSSSIILHPFAHQVGGHTQLLTFDKSTLCKPLIPRELLFYLNVPKELVNFVPTYKGVVQIRETGQGTYPPVVYQPLRSPKSPYAKCTPHHYHHHHHHHHHLNHHPHHHVHSHAQSHHHHHHHHLQHLHLQHQHQHHAGYHSEEDDDSSQQSVTETCGFPFELKVQIKPFSDEKVLKKNLSQDNLLRADYISRPNERYLLLLENVASKYQLPCILDLKMGTRQHGDDATEEKRHRQIAKCQASTSASLGVRLCGMQVYQVDYGGFLWYDKYYGRKMDKGGLKRALHEYFRNGSQLNEDIIDDVITRLKLLSNAVEKSPSFRFYGTSLLIIHEGGCAAIDKKCPVDVRLIDFAHTICDYANTNGRSSSSPSVLTKSSSAEQLTTSTGAGTNLTPAESEAATATSTTTTTTSATATSNADTDTGAGEQPRAPRVPSISPPSSYSSSRATSRAGTPAPVEQPPLGCAPDDLKQQQLGATQDSSLAGAAADVVSDACDDAENHFPGPRAAAAAPPPSSSLIESPALTSIACERNNNGGSTSGGSGSIGIIISSSSSSNNNNNNENNNNNNNNNNNDVSNSNFVRSNNSNGSKDNIATSLKTSTNSNRKHNLLKFGYQSTLETLREVDPKQQQHQQHVQAQSEQQTVVGAAGASPTKITLTSGNIAEPATLLSAADAPIGARKTSRASMGPDKGLLFGLENLMRLLDDLKSETLITTC